MISRRRFLRLSGAGAACGSTTLLAACGNKGAAPVTTIRNQADVADAEILNGLLDIELRSIAAYRAGERMLTGVALRRVRLVLEHERRHAQALSRAIEHAGGAPAPAKPSYRFAHLTSQRAMLMFAVGLEDEQVAAYIDALPKLTSTELRGTIAAILTTEAEHISVLRETLGLVPAPGAFVTGGVS